MAMLSDQCRVRAYTGRSWHCVCVVLRSHQRKVSAGLTSESVGPVAGGDPRNTHNVSNNKYSSAVQLNGFSPLFAFPNDRIKKLQDFFLMPRVKKYLFEINISNK